jgi:hypothetical protein
MVERILILPPSLRMSRRWPAAGSQTSAHYISNAFRTCNVLRLGFATAALRRVFKISTASRRNATVPGRTSGQGQACARIYMNKPYLFLFAIGLSTPPFVVWTERP